jgi:hypothetical protein
VSKREYHVPESPGLPWDDEVLSRYRRTLVGDKHSDYPPGFMEAVERYTDKEFVFRSEIFGGLRKWREHVERNPEDGLLCRIRPPTSDDYASTKFFKNLVLVAVFYGNKEILQALFDTVTLTKPPEPDMRGARAVIAAFCELFKGIGKDDWPLKKEVRERAIEILKAAGSLIPGRREWPRIFRKAGLSELRNAKRRSARLG